VAGNNSDAGKTGDVITALVPFSDDLLLFGGLRSLWLLRGDAAAGGSIDAVSYKMGISGPDAWTFDPQNMCYFFGSGAVWRMPLGGVPEPLSRGRLDATFGDIDLSVYNVLLEWGTDVDGLHMFVAPLHQASSPPRHYFWDRRSDSWWIDQYPATVGPRTALYVFDPLASRTGLVVGGYDGILRVANSASLNDDGTSIASHVDFAPIAVGQDIRGSRLTEVIPTLAEGSGDVRLEVYAGHSAETVVQETEPRFVKVVGGGRNTSVRQRVNGAFIRMRLANDGSVVSRWTTESLVGIIAPSGKIRRGHL
jgi:hypothetical protein